MKKFLIMMFAFSLSASAEINFYDYFSYKTMRVDYFHTGISTEEIFSLDQVYEEGEWPGTQTNLQSPIDAGLYRVDVFDKASGKLIFANGYNSIFGEWQTTNDAINGIYQTMHETVRLPWPLEPINLVISKRNRNNIFKQHWSTEIDPTSRFMNREKKLYPFRVTKFINNGDSQNKVDLLIIGDGYTKNDLKKFRKDISRYTKVLFASPPFDERKDDFNVWTIEALSQDSGIAQPRKNLWRRTALGCSYNTFDSERYVLSLHNKDIRDIASLAPYDAIYIIFNQPRYGGGGIYNSMATCYTGKPENQPDWWSDYVFVHEFGHSFAGLADEYYTSDVSYNDMYPLDVEPWEPNISTLNVDGKAKWADLITPDLSTPTTWKKAEYDSLGNLRRRVSVNDHETKAAIDKKLNQILEEPKLKSAIGCFEGGGYAANGVYRPSINCRMFSKSLVEFCPVCQQALVDMIDYYTK
jgi:hypothetical protein